MKKTITLFLSIALIGVGISQTLIKDKQKVISAKDTVKKAKHLFLLQKKILELCQSKPKHAEHQ
jgi:hypothetical protein